MTEVATTAVVNIQPQQDQVVLALHDQAVRLEEFAQQLIIENPDDVKRATDDLSIIAGIKKAIAGKRAEYVQPINAHLAAINEAFKAFTEPLLRADKLVRDKMLAYMAEVERKRQEQEEINRLRMEAAQKEMELTGELSESVDLVEIQPEAPKTVYTDMGMAGQRDAWKWEVVDFPAVPDAYKVIDSSQLTAIARKHHDTKPIPGVRFYNEPVIAVTKR